MRKLLLAATAASAVMLSGCASIVSNADYPVRLDSSPEAAFTVTDASGSVVYSGHTPETVILSASRGFFSRETYSIVYSAEGYKETQVTIKPTVDGWVIGNILFGGIPGLVIDGLTGAVFALPDTHRTHLKKADSAQASLQFFSLSELSEEDRDALVRIN